MVSVATSSELFNGGIHYLVIKSVLSLYIV